MMRVACFLNYASRPELLRLLSATGQIARSAKCAHIRGRALIALILLSNQVGLLSASEDSILFQDRQIRTESTTSSNSYELGSWRPIPPEGLVLSRVSVVLQASEGRYVGLDSTFDQTGGGTELTRPPGKPSVFSRVSPKDVPPEIVRAIQSPHGSCCTSSADSASAQGPAYSIKVSDQRFRVVRIGGSVVVDSALEQLFQLRPYRGRHLEAKVVYDETGGRFVVVAFESFDETGEPCGPRLSSIQWAVSDDSDPLGEWYLAEVPTFTEDQRMIRGEIGGVTGDPLGVVVWTRVQDRASEGGMSGTRIWILVRGDGQEGIYDGGRALVRVFGD